MKASLKKNNNKRRGGFAWAGREFEGCNVEGSLKWGKKKRLKPSGIAWENREFENYPPSCSTVS